MKVCIHIIEQGLINIPAAGGDFCLYCVDEDIAKYSYDSKYACKKPDCPAISLSQLHYHGDHAEAIGTPA
jgi:hypothetical protein